LLLFINLIKNETLYLEVLNFIPENLLQYVCGWACVLC
jgi:hypothetical protein